MSAAEGFVAFICLALIGFALTMLTVWFGLDVLAGFDLSFWQLVGIVIAAGAVSTRAEVKLS